MTKCDKSIVERLKVFIKVAKMPDKNMASNKQQMKNKPSIADMLFGMGEDRVMFR